MTGLGSGFYTRASKDTTFARIAIRSLESCNDMDSSDDFVEPLDILTSHMSTQLLKEINNLSTINATKSAKGNGGAAKDH